MDITFEEYYQAVKDALKRYYIAAPPRQEVLIDYEKQVTIDTCIQAYLEDGIE